MTRVLPLLLALAAGSAAAQDARPADVRDGPLRIASLDRSLVLTADGGELWVAAGTYAVGRLDAPVRLVADGGTVRLTGTASQAPLAAATAATAPARTALDAPFPNPFAQTATVPLALAEAAGADVRVVDVLGREVARLASGPRPAGTHTLTLDADGLANGVYVVVAEIRPAAGGSAVRLTQRLTLAR